MATANIRNPDDAANAGPREATRTQTEDAVTKHWPRVIIEDNRIRTGIYYVHSGSLAVQPTAHGAGAGFLWIVNHTGATSLIAIRRVRWSSQQSAATAPYPTSPRFLLERFTTSANPTGAQITAAKRRASDATPANWSVRTANTSLVQTAGAVVCGFLPSASLTAAGCAPATVDVWEPDLDEMPILAAGEGLRFYQADAGTASDTRKGVLDFIVSEFTEF